MRNRHRGIGRHERELAAVVRGGAGLGPACRSSVVGLLEHRQHLHPFQVGNDIMRAIASSGVRTSANLESGVGDAAILVLQERERVLEIVDASDAHQEVIDGVIGPCGSDTGREGRDDGENIARALRDLICVSKWVTVQLAFRVWSSAASCATMS